MVFATPRVKGTMSCKQAPDKEHNRGKKEGPLRSGQIQTHTLHLRAVSVLCLEGNVKQEVSD